MASRHKPWFYVDPALLPTQERRWIAVYNVLRRVIEHREIPPGADLPGELVKALAAHVEQGFVLEDFSSKRASAFCHRGTERREIAVTLSDPTKEPLPMYTRQT